MRSARCGAVLAVASVCIWACAEDVESDGPDEVVLHVAADAQSDGDGSSSAPYRTITGALAQARTLRFGLDGRDPSSLPITITVGPGTYQTTLDADALAADPSLEAGPLLLNVDHLTLRGSTRLEHDAEDLPTGEAVPGTETIVTWRDGEWTGRERGGESLLLVGPTIHAASSTPMVGHDVTVEGLVIRDVPSDFAFFGPRLITLERVQGFAVRGNVLDGQFGAFIDVAPNRSSGTVEGNYITGANAGGIVPWGGDDDAPAVITVRGNRITGNGFYAVVPVGQDAHFETPSPGLNAGFAVPPAAEPSVTEQSITLVCSDNEFSDHGVAGIRAGIVSRSVHPDVTAGHLTLDVRRNAILGNEVGIVVDALFPTRMGGNHMGFFVVEHHWTGSVDLHFSDNRMEGTQIPATFEFTSSGTPPDDPDFEPLADAVYRVTDPDGQLEGFQIIHPLMDPVDERALNNLFEYNGEEVPADSGP